MKTFILSAVTGILLFQRSAWSHDLDSRVEIEVESAATVPAGAIDYKFQLVDSKLKKAVTDRDLNITHEKKLHLLIYDPALQEFRHVHPEFDGQVWQTKFNLPVNGNYWIWAQGALSADKEEFSAPSRLQVQGGRPAWSTPPALNDVRQGEDHGSVVSLSDNQLRAGKMVMLMMAFSRKDGTQPVLSPYLGAMAHVVAVADDADTLVHVHPMEGGSPHEGMLHMTFPRPGAYRLWVQYVDANVLRLVPLSVLVKR